MNVQSVRIFASAMVTNKVCLAVKSMLSKHIADLPAVVLASKNWMVGRPGNEANLSINWVCEVSTTHPNLQILALNLNQHCHKI